MSGRVLPRASYSDSICPIPASLDSKPTNGRQTGHGSVGYTRIPGRRATAPRGRVIQLFLASFPSSAADSLNLESFRHVTSLLSTSPNLDPSSRPSARRRPRGDSIAATHLSLYPWLRFEKSRHTTAPQTPLFRQSSPGNRDSCLAMYVPTAFVLCPTL